METSHRHRVGILRREFLQVGFSGLLSVGLNDLVAARAQAGSRVNAVKPRAKSVILVFLTGGLSHIDSFDMKPDAPEGIRGEFRPIETAVPGIPILRASAPARRPARQAGDRPDHAPWIHQPPERDPRDFDRSFAAGCVFRQDRLARRLPLLRGVLSTRSGRASDGVPSGVMLPTFLMEGPLTWPGQHAGFLGPKHDPWQVKQDPEPARLRFRRPDPARRPQCRAARSPQIAARGADHGPRPDRRADRPDSKIRWPRSSSGRMASCSRAKSPGHST